MKDETIKALEEVCDALQELASGVVLHTGVETATKVLNATYKLKLELPNEKESSE